MKELIQHFPSQILDALEIGRSIKWKFASKKFEQVILSGLGGSGIGGSIVADALSTEIRIPFIVNKNYDVPACCGTNTLFIACSYSGNTEETLEAVKQAKKRKAQIVCITSGGELAQFATKNDLPLISIPAGMPPRACLGYSLVQILFVLHKASLCGKGFVQQFMDGLTLLDKKKQAIRKEAGTLANFLYGRAIAIYTVVPYEGLAIRFRQQLNENSKVLAWHNVVPEMTHNEIVGWKERHENLAVLFCYHREDYERNLRRVRYLKKTVSGFTPHVKDLVLQGNSYWEKVLYFIHLTDWVSVYLSDLNGHDPVEVRVIDGLKKEMAKK